MGSIVRSLAGTANRPAVSGGTDVRRRPAAQASTFVDGRLAPGSVTWPA